MRKVPIWHVMLCCLMSGSFCFETSQCLHHWGSSSQSRSCLTLKMEALFYSEMLITIVQCLCHILEDQNLVIFLLWFYFHRQIIIIKSFYSLWSIGHPWRASRHCNLQPFPWPHSMMFLLLLFHPLLSVATFSLAYLFFCIPEDSNLMLFSLLLLLLCIICVQSSSIFFYLSDFLLASVGWFSIVRRLYHRQMAFLNSLSQSCWSSSTVVFFIFNKHLYLSSYPFAYRSCFQFGWTFYDGMM